LEENTRGAAADSVREGCRHPDGWGSSRQGELEIETDDKAEDSGNEKSEAREPALMQVSFNIPGPLRQFTEDRSNVRIEVKTGADLREALQELFAAYPGLCDRVLTETGETRQHVNIFVAYESVRYTGGLATVVPDGAEVSIVPAISGG
jgi:molybdopterin converting factor small subunit